MTDDIKRPPWDRRCAAPPTYQTFYRSRCRPIWGFVNRDGQWVQWKKPQGLPRKLKAFLEGIGELPLGQESQKRWDKLQ